jgi:hypothetical protein
MVPPAGFLQLQSEEPAADGCDWGLRQPMNNFRTDHLATDQAACHWRSQLVDRLCPGALTGAALVAGDPWALILAPDVPNDDSRFRVLNKVSDTRHKVKGAENSDLISVVHIYLHSFGLKSAALVGASIAERRTKTFHHEFLDLPGGVAACMAEPRQFCVLCPKVARIHACLRNIATSQ